MTDSALIDDLGGPARVAELLGYEKVGGVQRVHNWRVRGIPARVKLEHPELFLRPMVQGPSPTQTTEGPARAVA